MLPTKFSFWRYYSIILVCWLGINDAIPYGAHTDEKQVNPNASWNPRGSVSSKNSRPVSGPFQSLDGRSKLATDVPDESSENATEVNSNIYTNINKGRLHPVRTRTSTKKPPVNQAHSRIQDENECMKSMSSAMNLSDKIAHCIDEQDNGQQSKKDEVVLQECPISGRRSNEVPSQSFPHDGPSINVEGAFEVGGEAEAKKTSNVYTGEDITLCWIELITIKEDSASSPPKKLVIREFAISFENSDTIPEGDMDCSRIRGEISPGEEKTVCESSLNEMIVDDTRRSRVVELKKDSQADSINIRQYKKVKCATGSVVSKAIYEWPDGTDNPKKRVEIKVGPSVRNVHSGKDGEPPLCPPDLQDEVTSTPISECPIGGSCERSMSCKDTGTCNETRTSTSCEDGMCVTTPVPEMILTTTHSPVPDEATTNRPIKVKDVIRQRKVLPSKPDTESVKSCPQGDCTAESSEDPESIKDCSQADCTAEPSNDMKNTEDCSEGDCAAQSSDETPDDKMEDSASLCTGDHCISEEDSTTSQKGMVSGENEKCQEGSEACDCSASSCLDGATDAPNSLVAEQKVTEETTTVSSTEIPRIAHNDIKCESQSGECLNSSTSSSDGEDMGITPTSIGKDDEIDVQSTVDDKEMSTKRNDVVPTTSSTEKITIANTSSSTPDTTSTEIPPKSTVPSCLDVTSEDCVIAKPTSSNGTEQSTSEPEKYPSTTPNTMPLVTTEENPMIHEIETSSVKENSCEHDSTGANCETTGSPDQITLQVDNVTSELLPESANASHLTPPEEPENTVAPVDSPSTPIPMTTIVSEIPLIQDSTKLPDNLPVIDEETPTNDDSSIEKTSEVLKNAKVETEPCESSEDCDPTGDSLSSTKSSESSSINSVASVESCGNNSCNDTSEACAHAVSSNSCEDCEDGSLSENCAGNESPEQIGTDELIDTTMTPTMEPSVEEVGHFSTTINNVSEPTGSRRTTVTSPLQQETEGKHKLALRIKVLLEHIDDKEEKEKLVQLEKHLLLDEMLDQHGNHSLIWHLKSLNNSQNIETFKSIFNLTDLDNLTEVFSHVTEFNEGGLKKMSTLKTQGESESESNKTLLRAKRNVLDADKIGEKAKNITDATKVKAIKESLPGVNEDFQKGLGHVLGEISHELNGGASRVVNKSAESSTSTIMKILANPGDKRVHSRRRKRATNVGEVSIKELKHPVIGDEIGRWSNERFVMAGDGGRVRSLLEFEIMRDPSDDLGRIHLDS